MRAIIAFLSLFLCSLLIISCRETGTSPEVQVPPQPDRGVFIVNEGAFPNAGTISFYNLIKDSVIQSAIGVSANWITPNDAKVVGNRLYVVVNGNDRIEVRDATSFQSLATIQLPVGSGPGFLCVIDDTRACVANYDGTVSMIDLTQNTLQVTSTRIVTFPGGITMQSGKIFLSDYGPYTAPKNIVKVLDPNSLAVLDSIRVGAGAGAMTRSGNRIYVSCSGVFPSNGRVYAINSQTNSVVDSVSVGQGPSDIGFYGQYVFVLHGTQVMRLDASPLSVHDTSFVSLTNGLYYYSMQIDDVQGDVYVAKIVTTGGLGEVEIYTAQAVLKRSPFAVGVFPGAFGFK